MADDGLLDETRTRTRSPAPASRRWAVQRETAWDWAAAFMVLATYTVVQFVFLEGPHPFDPAKYFATAVDFPDVPPDLWTLRIGLVAPLVVAVDLLGESEIALYIVPFIVSLALAGAVYATTLLLFRQRVLAAATALVAVLNTNWLLNSSHIFPDTTATATFTGAFLLLVFAGLRSERGEGGHAVTFALAGAGVLLGWTYLARDFSPVLLPAVVAAVLILRYSWRHVALVGGAAVATLLLDLVHGYAVHGDALIHLRALRAHRGAEEISGQLDGVVDVLLLFPRLLLSWRVGWFFIVLLALFLAALAVFRDRRLWLLGAWFLSFWGVITVIGLASLPTERWFLNVSNIRYWYPVFPPLVMGAFGGLALFARRFAPARGVLLTSGVAVALVGLTLGPGFVEFERCSAKDVWTRDPAERWSELRAWLSTPVADRYSVMWTDYRTERLVPVFTRTTFGQELWDGRLENFGDDRSRVVAPVEHGGALLLIHKDRLQWVGRAPERLRALRTDWRPLFISSDGRMIVLAHESTTAGDPAYAGRAWWALAAPTPRPTVGCGLRPGHRDRAAAGTTR